MQCGSNVIDIKDWQAHTNYQGGCSKDTPCVVWFWKYVRSLDHAMRAKLLYYSTSISRLSHEGFAGLKDRFTISMSTSATGLPTAQTCFATLVLPGSFHVSLG